MKATNTILAAMAITSVSGGAMAAGFALNSQSATGIGRAMAGDAVIADNASVLARNPAALALFDSKALSAGLTYADVDIEISDAVLHNAGGAEHLGSISDAGSGTVIPNIYYIQPVSDRWAFGFGAFSNFGTGTDTFSLEGAPDILVGNTEITTVDFNASFSFRLNKHFSLGAGVDLIYGKGELGRGSSLDGLDNLLHVDASGIAFGGILGATYEINERNRLGLSYRYSPTVTAKGDVNLLTTPGGNSLVEFDEIKVPLPDIFQFAGFHQLTQRFALSYTAQWTKWSVFDSIEGIDGTAAGRPIGDQVLKEYGWNDSWLYSVGGTYNIGQKWIVRAGYMRDNGVVDEISSLSIPDSDRNWFTAGFSYHLSPASAIDFGFAYIQGEESDVTEPSIRPGESVSATTLSGATYYSVQYSHSF